MSWTLPKERFSGVMSDEEFNANIRAFAEEIDGNLNEHNFTRFAAAATTAVAADTCTRVYTEVTQLSPTAGTGTMQFLKQTEAWLPVPDTEVDWKALGSKVMAFCSFQIKNPPSLDESGLNFCLSLDGIPQVSTLIGTGDQGNDLIQMSRLTGKTFTFDFGSGPGIMATNTALVCRGNFTVTPGVHTIGLMYRNLSTSTTLGGQHVSQRTTIVIPMWA